ncbi:MAG: Flp pilus assembly complex ATPase component TadA [Lachnospiraceae bacterium]|nr:Flp pilus assembly complex ATPase component TadA [Lachnospiraceae bacterium]
MDDYSKKVKSETDRIRKAVINSLNTDTELSDEEVYETVEKMVLKGFRNVYCPFEKKQRIITQIFNSIRKLDVLQELIEDNEINEIMINGPSEIFYEKNGQIVRFADEFSSKEKLEDVIQQIASNVNRVVNEKNPILDLRLSDGSRVNIVLPPVALNGPIVTIRKFPDKQITMEDMIRLNTISEEAAMFLKKIVKAKYNIFISGGTSSGKTTFLNALSNFIPSDERIITIEDSAELRIQNIPNLVRLESRNKNVEGKNDVSIRELVRSSLRMRPDRIIVGEVRGKEALDMLSCLNSGHLGFRSLLHSHHQSQSH